MSQRLGIAGALLGDPGILLFDEPVQTCELWIDPTRFNRVYRITFALCVCVTRGGTLYWRLYSG